MGHYYNFRKMIEGFLNECENQRCLDKKTMRAYRVDLQQFYGFIENQETVSRENISKYIELLNSKYKPNSVKRKLACIRSFFSYAEYNNLIERTPFAGMRIRLRRPVVLPRNMILEEISCILKYSYSELNLSEPGTYKYHTKLRNVAVLEMLFATGIRVSELCSMRPEDIHVLSGKILIHGKGSRERMVQICNIDVLSILEKYSNEFSDDIEHSGFFFVNRIGKGLSDQSVRNMVHSYATESIGRNITPHMFRHSFATLLLEEDVDLRYIQRALGHSSIVTTERYLSVSDSKQKDIMSKKHPRNRVKTNE